MLSWEIHLSHQREKNPSSHLVRSMQRSEREAPVKCFFCGWKLGGLQMKRETLSGEVIHPRRVVWEITFFLFKLVLGRPWSSLFYPFLSFRRLKVDKQVKSRAADSQAVEKIGCDTSPSRAATQLHPPSKVRRVEGFSLTLEPPTFGSRRLSSNEWFTLSGLSKPRILQIPRSTEVFFCFCRSSAWTTIPFGPPCFLALFLDNLTFTVFQETLIEMRVQAFQRCYEAIPAAEGHEIASRCTVFLKLIISCYSDLCWLTQHVLVGMLLWQNQRPETLKCPNPEGVTVKSQTLRTL